MGKEYLEEFRQRAARQEELDNMRETLSSDRNRFCPGCARPTIPPPYPRKDKQCLVCELEKAEAIQTSNRNRKFFRLYGIIL